MNNGIFFMIGCHEPVVSQKMASLLSNYNVGGVIIFKKAYENLEQLKFLISDLRAQATADLIIGVDQEGGRVIRLSAPFTKLPAMHELVRMKSQEQASLLAAEAGATLGKELKDAGFDIDFAPVLDVWSNPANEVIGDRAFSGDPETVSICAAAFIDAMQKEGLSACGKHFPGHGDTALDSHFALPEVLHDLETLSTREFVPFRAAIEAGVNAMMMAHLKVPAIDDEQITSLSNTAHTILREELGFKGAIFTDDLTMKGLTSVCSTAQAAPLALSAGADVLLLCHDVELNLPAALGEIDMALNNGTLKPDRLMDAQKNIQILY